MILANDSKEKSVDQIVNNPPSFSSQYFEEDPPPPFNLEEDDSDSVYSTGSFDSDVTLGQDSAPNYSELKTLGRGLSSCACVTPRGHVVISLDLRNKLPDLPQDHAREVKEFAVDERAWRDVPPMNIVIMIVGSRGDVQPYVALGKALLKDGHRIRIASHATFQTFVLENGLEFFDIGGNPQDLMSYMVKNPGLMPGMESLKNGDILKKRKMLAEMMNGCWLSCHYPCPQTGRPFAADAIISNPPAFAHVHCAEALGIPLLMSFTMPWSPTTAFHHPLAQVKTTNAERGLTNILSYALVDLLTWQGIGDIINKFRNKTLGIHSLSVRSGPGLVDRVRVPWTYCMSPALVPKPKDWTNYIDVAGFYFLDLATAYTPPAELSAFLNAGETPIYIGFGSVMVDDAKAMTDLIFEATKQVGVRALVSAGWGGLGGMTVPEHIFILGNVPHDWLFASDRVSAVVHHGGAGTTAVGLAKGQPTLVVPFFGDQEFWGMMVHKAGAGPAPIPHRKLTVESLKKGIEFLISKPAKKAAAALADKIHAEDGVRAGVASFYQHLPLLNMRCDLEPKRLAVWWSTKHCLKLSAYAAQALSDAKQINISTLDPHRTKEYDTKKQFSDPITGGATAIFWTATHAASGVAQIFYSPVKGIINTTTALPRGFINAIYNVHEGLLNAPKLYGSNVRQAGKITGLGSGLKEAGKGLSYGLYDGITGLVREPLEGARKDGLVGALKGGARAPVNAVMRPAAGLMGIVAYSFQGAWKEVQTAFHRNQDQKQRSTRIVEGIQAVRASTPAEREEVLRKFKLAQETTSVRVKTMKKLAHQVLYEDRDEKKSSSSDKERGSDEHSKFEQQQASSSSSTSPSPSSSILPYQQPRDSTSPRQLSRRSASRRQQGSISHHRQKSLATLTENEHHDSNRDEIEPERSPSPQESLHEMHRVIPQRRGDRPQTVLRLGIFDYEDSIMEQDGQEVNRYEPAPHYDEREAYVQDESSRSGPSGSVPGPKDWDRKVAP